MTLQDEKDWCLSKFSIVVVIACLLAVAFTIWWVRERHRNRPIVGTAAFYCLFYILLGSSCYACLSWLLQGCSISFGKQVANSFGSTTVIFLSLLFVALIQVSMVLYTRHCIHNKRKVATASVPPGKLPAVLSVLEEVLKARQYYLVALERDVKVAAALADGNVLTYHKGNGLTTLSSRLYISMIVKGSQEKDAATELEEGNNVCGELQVEGAMCLGYYFPWCGVMCHFAEISPDSTSLVGAAVRRPLKEEFEEVLRSVREAANEQQQTTAQQGVEIV